MANKLVDLVYWRKMRRTGVVFTGLVISLASLFQLSAITVISHICLGVMCVTFSLRLYYKLLELLRWNPGVHPFESYLDHDSSLTDKETVMVVEEVVLLIAFAITEIKRLLFIESVIDSIKFVLLLYLLTYVGVLTSGVTLVIAAVIVVFSLPLFYKKQQMRIRRMVRAVKAFVKRIKNLSLSLYHKVRPSSAPAPAPAPKPATAPAAAAAPGPKQKAKSK
ncbi:LOW QUALITY PROTEIN: reticulon-2b [Cottoperca gobio]|uniref:Reticulon n=1 Tax=Cottoperca gobio TaxID=56716 RepID=A0A6J2R082_COTGO|nr:LOW QUALITY PROTEIN: reticulon-2-like [Cottoperca gobio]